MPQDRVDGPDRWVAMGRIAGAFGVRGWIRIAPFTEDRAALLDYPTWWLEGADGWSARRVVEARAHGSGLVAQLEGVADRDDAERLKGVQIGQPRSVLPPPAEGEVYWADLPGLGVVNRDGVALGRVVDVQENGAHGLLRVRPETGAGNDRLIPFVPAIVLAVDLEAGRVEVDWEADW